MPDRSDELKRRVGRLISGEINTRDLDVLFLWLRARSFGHKTVADVGNFVAHSDERERGVAWQGAQHFFNVARFLLPRMGDNSAPPGTLDDLKIAARSAFELSTPAEVQAATGLAKNKASKILSDALGALASLNGRELAAKRPLSPQEVLILKRYTSVLISKAAFTDTELISELLLCLKKNRLIEHVPEVLPDQFSALVALYAVEKMHRARIALSDGKMARLTAGISIVDGNEFVGVSASAPVDHAGFELDIAFPIYMTSLDAWVWCEPELLPAHHFMGSDWHFAIEIGPSGKLQML